MDVAGLAFGILPIAMQLLQYLQNVKVAPASCQTLIEQFELYIEYAQQLPERTISNEAGRSLQQQRVAVEKLNAILQDPKLQKLLSQPEIQSSTIVASQDSATFSTESSVTSTAGSTTASGDHTANAISETESSHPVAVKKQRKRDIFKEWVALRPRANKDSQHHLSPTAGLNSPQPGTGPENSQTPPTSSSVVERTSTIEIQVNRWVWPFEEAEFKELSETLEQVLDILRRMLQLENMSTVAQAETVVVDKHSKLEDEAREEAYEWLSPLTFEITQENVYAKLEPGTGTWVLEDEKFTKWLRGEFRALFCHGMPGAGKTTLMSVVIKHLKDEYYTKQDAFGNKPVGLAFLFCNNVDGQVQTLQNLLGSILRQLEKRCYITPDLGELYGDYWGKEKRSLPLKNVMERVKKCASALEKVFIIVDALDESPHQHELVHLHLFDLIRSHSNVQLLATSRPNPGIDEFLKEEGCSSLEIRAKDSDMRLYLDARIKGYSKKGESLYNLVHADSNLWNGVIERIMQQACGIFLVAQLHIASISNMPSRKRLKEALSIIPNDLESTYHNAVARIEELNVEFWEMFQKGLMVVSFSCDWLDPDALLDVIATNEDTGFEKDDRMFTAYVISNCGGLLVEEAHKSTAQNTTKKTIIRFLHQSVREFFGNNPNLLVQSVNNSNSPTELIAEAHATIALVCLAYLFTDRGEAYQNAQWEGQNLSGSFHFLRYAFCYWGVHASKASNDRIKDKLYQLFDQEWHTGDSNAQRRYQIFDTFWDFQHYPSLQDRTLYRRIHAASGSGSIFVAAVVFDLRVLVEEYILQRPNFIPSLPESILRRCLTAAAWNGNMDLLLQLWVKAADIDINSSDDAIGPCMKSITPLWAAAHNGHDNAVKLLLANDRVDVNVATKDGSTPLYEAARQGHDKVIELLLADSRIDVNVGDKDGDTPLHIAASCGHTSIAKLLLAHDKIDYRKANTASETALDRATKHGHREIAVMLLTKLGNDNKT